MNHSLVSVLPKPALQSLQQGARLLAGILMAAVLFLPAATSSAQGVPSGPAAAPQADYQCFYPVADTYADSTDPGANFGGDPTIVVQHTDVGGTIKTTFLQFDLSAIPNGSAILAANLKLYLTQTSAQAAYQLGRATSPWQEYNLTWNNQPGHGGVFDNPTHDETAGWKTWNAVQPVSDWVGGFVSNYGFTISSGLLDSPSLFSSRESTSNGPRLCVEWTTSGGSTDLRFTGLEVTQGVQDLNNSVRLVAGKRTFVRLHADSTQGDWRTFASLAITCDGSGQVLYPINPGTNGYIAIGESPDRAVQNEAFLFELPSNCTDEAEQIRLSGLVNPTTTWRGEYPPETSVLNNWSGEYFLTFESAPKLDTIVYLADYEYSSGGGMVGVSTLASEAYALSSWLERAYPIPDNWLFLRHIDFGEAKIKVKDGVRRITNPSASKFNSKLATKRKWDLAHDNWYEDIAGNEREIRYYGMIDSEAGLMRGRAKGSKPVSSGPTGDNFFLWDNDGSYGDWYGGHEIGHTLGRSHVACSGDEKGPDGNYPHTNGLISTAQTGANAFYGFDYGDLDNGIYGPTWSDVMSYCSFQWISDYTTHGILDYMQSQVATTLAASPAAGNYLLVVGYVDVISSTAELEPLFVLPDPIDVEASVPGDYDIVLRSGSGSELARYAFTPEPMDPGPDVPGEPGSAPAELLISEMVPYVSGTDQVAIEGPAGVLAQVSAGASAPAVTVLSPNGGETLSGDVVDVSWTASDADADDLSFSIEFSPDSGATWELVVHGVSGSSYAIRRQNILSSSGQGLFRVWVSDGIHTSSDTSDAGFTVTSRAPELTIVSPEDGLIIAQQQTLSLQAIAYSDIAGLLGGDQPRWVSNLDGLVATGDSTTVTGLSEGTHTIIVVADDGQRTSYADFQVTVVADPSLLPTAEDDLRAAPKAAALHPHLGVTSSQISLNNASGTKPLDWQAFESTPWLGLSATTGTTAGKVTVSVDASGLEPGEYTSDVVFLTGDIPGGSSETVSVAFSLPAAKQRLFLPVILR